MYVVSFLCVFFFPPQGQRVLFILVCSVLYCQHLEQFQACCRHPIHASRLLNEKIFYVIITLRLCGHIKMCCIKYLRHNMSMFSSEGPSQILYPEITPFSPKPDLCVFIILCSK